MGSVPGSGRSPGEGNGNPLQDSCLENPMDRGAWQATVHGVTKRVGHNLVTKQQHKLVLSALRVNPVCWFGLSSFTLGCSTPDRKFCFSTWSQMSVLNMVVSRHPGNTEPVKAKEELIFHCGFRRFRASPLFSQHTAGKQGSFWVFVHFTVF